MSQKLDEWMPSDYKRSGFNEKGGTSPALRQKSGKPQFTPSPGFATWLAASGGSLVFSTYQTGCLFFLGTRADGTFFGMAQTGLTPMLKPFDYRLT